MAKIFVLLVVLTLSVGAFAQDIQRDVPTPWVMVFKVDITTQWSPTGFAIESGDTILIMADGIASTEGANPSPRQFEWIGPEGRGQSIAVAGFPMAGVPEQCVLGKIGLDGAPFYIGRGLGFKATKSGTLYLGYNDTDFSQNYGTYILYLFRYPTSVPLGMVRVAGGTFSMGSASGTGEADERPQHSVTVSSFDISKTEITFDQYDQFCNEASRTKPDDFGWGRGTRPVINVSWEDANAFCSWASSRTGRTVRLPTEAEWEFAAQGGTLAQSPRYTYSGSNSLDDIAWWSSNSGGLSQPVATKLPNELGLYDMCGNVWEWCSDWYSDTYYSVSPSKNPEGPRTGTDRVLRGGSWGNAPGYDFSFGVADRHWSPQTEKWFSIGFRCVESVVTSAHISSPPRDVPREFGLSQNFPNPFNPSTTIRYALPARSHVSLTVFNTLGQQVAQLVDGEMDAGYQEAQFNATNLSSGVYFYRLQAGTFTETKRLLLLR